MLITAILFATIDRITVDAYIVDVLMPDLVGHDQRSATFLVYPSCFGRQRRRDETPFRSACRP